MNQRKYALIINRDHLQFAGPLNTLLGDHSALFEVIYHTDFFPPQSNKWKYIRVSLSIVGFSYLLRICGKYLLSLFLSIGLTPKKWTLPYSLKSVCRKYGIPYIYVNHVNNKSFYKDLKEKGVNTVLSMTSQIYRSEILGKDDVEFYNIHPGLLPNNKGRFPIFWAIVHGDKQGLTCHRITKKIDEGKIVHQEELMMDGIKRVEQIMDEISLRMPHFINDAVEVLEGRKKAFVGTEYPSFYGPFPSKEDILKYRLKLKD